jgi:hypothetical protein
MSKKQNSIFLSLSKEEEEEGGGGNSTRQVSGAIDK